MYTRQGVACVVLVFSFLLIFPTLTAAQKKNFNSDEYLSGELSADTVAADTGFGKTTEFKGSGEAGVDLFWLILKICGVLIFISGGIYGLARLLKNTGFAGGGNDFMQVVSSLSVGQEKYLQVVKIGKQFLVIGVTDGSINRVCEINDGETIQTLRRAAEENDTNNSGNANDFSSTFRRFLGNTVSSASSRSSAGDPLEEMQKKLNDISTPGEQG